MWRDCLLSWMEESLVRWIGKRMLLGLRLRLMSWLRKLGLLRELERMLTMGKRSRREKRRRIIAETLGLGKGDNVPGGYQGALFRGHNGQATQADVDYLLRLRRE